MHTEGPKPVNISIPSDKLLRFPQGYAACIFPNPLPLRFPIWLAGFTTNSTTVEATNSCRIGLASNLAATQATSFPSTHGQSRVSVERLPQVDSKLCGHWLQPIRLRLWDRLD